VYTIEEISLADTDQLFRFKREGLYKITFRLKGFEYPWILSSHKWQPGERVLDVGAGYASFARHLAEAYGCDSWIADDFGLASGEPFWTRGRSPRDHVAAHPAVTYVLERLGDPARSSLPEGSFDVVFSASALEHVPAALAPRVWRHMDRLLKPGGRLIHAIDVGFPSNFGVGRLALHLAARAASRRLGRRWPARLAGPCDKEFAFARTHGAGMVLAGIGLDAVEPARRHHELRRVVPSLPGW
jgi:SAM-dependent methyltransferase